MFFPKWPAKIFRCYSGFLKGIPIPIWPGITVSGSRGPPSHVLITCLAKGRITGANGIVCCAPLWRPPSGLKVKGHEAKAHLFQNGGVEVFMMA